MSIFNIFKSKSETSEEIVEKNNELELPDEDSKEEKSTKGIVYVISNVGSFGKDVYKIGATKQSDPMGRIKDLSDASVPFKFAVHAFIKSDDVYELESQIHRFLRDKEMNKINHKKEFFKCTLDEIKDIVKKLGYKNVKWDDNAIDVNYLKSKEIELRSDN